MILNVHYKKNKHQREFHKDLTSKYLHLSTGFGGGKSYSLVMKALQLSYINRPFQGGCVVPTLADFKKDLLPLFEEILEANQIKYHYHKTDKWFRFPWSPGRLYVVTAENKIRGNNWSYAVLNESTLITHERYKETIGRVRIKKAACPQIASSGTPEGTAHWKYETFIEKPMSRSRIIFGDTRDNEINLGSDYVQSLLESYDSIMVDAYLKGLFVNMLSNRFYYAFDPRKNCDETIARIPGERVSVTVDFNVDPMCATLWHVLPVYSATGFHQRDLHGHLMNQAIAFDQVEISGPDGADTYQLCDALIAKGISPTTDLIYPDPAGRARSTKGVSDVQIFKNRGFLNIRHRNVAPDMRKRQLATNNMLEKGLIKLNPKRCPGLKKDLEAVEQDKNTLEKIKKNPKLTHFSDGMDYFVDIEFPLSGTKPNSRMTRVR